MSIYDFNSNKSTNLPRPEPGLEMTNVVSGPVIVRVLDGHTVIFVHGLYPKDSRLVQGLFRNDTTSGRQSLVADLAAGRIKDIQPRRAATSSSRQRQ